MEEHRAARPTKGASAAIPTTVALALAVSVVLSTAVCAPAAPGQTVAAVSIPVPAPSPTAAARARSWVRAVAGASALQRSYTKDPSAPWGLLETAGESGSTASATLWPYSQALVATLLLASGAEGRAAYLPIATTLAQGLGAYWDPSTVPPGYASSLVPAAPATNPGVRRYFDDNAWAGLALVQLYRMTGDPGALAQAQRVFEFIVSGWDTDPTHPAPGGVWWSQQMPNPRFIHRNAVSTAPSAELALHLYELTGRAEPEYLAWGERLADWVHQNLQVQPSGLYGDHVDLAGVVDPILFTYNQGAMIGASVLRYRATGDAAQLDRARTIAASSAANFGAHLDRQPAAFNAIFVRRLLMLETETGDTTYRAWVQEYADTLWETARDPATGLFLFRYARPNQPNPPRLLDQAALVQIYAALALEPAAYRYLT